MLSPTSSPTGQSAATVAVCRRRPRSAAPMPRRSRGNVTATTLNKPDLRTGLRPRDSRAPDAGAPAARRLAAVSCSEGQRSGGRRRFCAAAPLDLADGVDHRVEGQQRRGMARLVVAHRLEHRDVGPLAACGGAPFSFSIWRTASRSVAQVRRPSSR